MMRRLQGGYYTDVRRKCCNTFYGRSCWANLFAYLLEVPLAQRIIRCVIPSVVLVGQICCFFNKKCHLLSGLSAALFSVGQNSKFMKNLRQQVIRIINTSRQNDN
jgi:hypothetical protein